MFSPYFSDKIEKSPQTTLNNLTHRLHQANKDKALWGQINNLHQAVETEFSGKDDKAKRKILDEFFNDSSTIQQKINNTLAQ